MSELKNCPFCGGEAIQNEPEQHGGMGGEYESVTIVCKECRVKLHGRGDNWATAEQEAIDAWNTRADGWISVEDEPVAQCRKVEVYNGEDVFIDIYRGEGVPANITHWRIPSPPKEKP